MKNEQSTTDLMQDNFELPHFFENNNYFIFSFGLGAFFLLLGVIVMYFTPPFPIGAGGFNVSGHPIFYMVSEAFLAFTLFTIGAASGVLFFWKKNPIFDSLTVAAVKTGVLASALTLLIGMVWAKAEWGYYWQWDPREVMALLMFLFYLGVLIFRSTVDDYQDKAKLTAVLAIAAFPTVPMTDVIVGSLHPTNVLLGGNISSFPLDGVILFLIGTFFMYLCLVFLTIEHERLYLEVERKKFILMANND